MTYTLAQATPGAQAFDTDTPLTINTISSLRALGYACAIRYVSRTTPCNPGDITSTEAQVILDAGLALMLVQHCPPAYWSPFSMLGVKYAMTASNNAANALYPPGATLWLDLENMRPGCGIPAIAAYVNAWYQTVLDGGYVPGLYYTADCPLTPEQLYLDLRPQLYWRGLSQDAPYVAVRGACMQQYVQLGQVAGIDLDRDVIVPDALGGLLPSWAIAA
jgi:Domain of unknown function (DUF1906)